MKTIKTIIKKWNEGFERGFSIFQWVLIISMFIFIFQDNRVGILFSLFVILLAYFEPFYDFTKEKQK